MFRIPYEYNPNDDSKKKLVQPAHEHIMDGELALRTLADHSYHKFYINKYSSALSVVYGLHFLYHFHPRAFMKINFSTYHDRTYTRHGILLTSQRWLIILNRLHKQLKLFHGHPLNWIVKHYPGYIEIDNHPRLYFLTGDQIKATPQTMGFRIRLRDLVSQRCWFTAVFDRYSKTHIHHRYTVKLMHIMHNNIIVARRMWLIDGKDFQQFGGLKKGTRICFRARVKKYHKGKYQKLTDYCLCYPTNVKII